MPTQRAVAPRVAANCNICNDETALPAIDHALAAGFAYEIISRELGFTPEELELHEQHGIAAKEKRGRQSVEALTKRLHVLDSVLKHMRQRLEKTDPRTAIMAVREQSRIIEQLGKMTGVVRPDTEVNINLNATPLPALEDMAVRLGKLDTADAQARRAAAARWLASGEAQDWERLEKARKAMLTAPTPLPELPEVTAESITDAEIVEETSAPEPEHVFILTEDLLEGLP